VIALCSEIIKYIWHFSDGCRMKLESLGVLVKLTIASPEHTRRKEVSDWKKHSLIHHVVLIGFATIFD
jgi:hypothetical protein